MNPYVGSFWGGVTNMLNPFSSPLSPISQTQRIISAFRGGGSKPPAPQFAPPPGGYPPPGYDPNMYPPPGYAPPPPPPPPMYAPPQYPPMPQQYAPAPQQFYQAPMYDWGSYQGTAPMDFGVPSAWDAAYH